MSDTISKEIARKMASIAKRRDYDHSKAVDHLVEEWTVHGFVEKSALEKARDKVESLTRAWPSIGHDAEFKQGLIACVHLYELAITEIKEA